jgi:hypothetical protein
LERIIAPISPPPDKKSALTAGDIETALSSKAISSEPVPARKILQTE